MAQIFHPSTNTISKLSLFGTLLLLLILASVIASINRSPYVTHAQVTQDQPVQFSHKHHVGDDGIDCRYCHTSVEQSSFAERAQVALAQASASTPTLSARHKRSGSEWAL